MRSRALVFGVVVGIPGCWTLTASVSDLSDRAAGTKAVDGDAGQPSDGAPGSVDAASADEAGTSGFCARALADAGGALLEVCFDYDAERGDGSLGLTSFGGATIRQENGDARSLPGALAIALPADPPDGCGATHKLPTIFAPKRVELSFDVRIERTLGQAGSFGQLGGYRRGDVYAYLYYDYRSNQLFFGEQDQRDGGTANYPGEQALTVDLTRWQRVELSVNYATGQKAVHIVDGQTLPDAPLAVSPGDVPGIFVVGPVYSADNPAPIRYRYDNVVMRAW